MAFSLAGKNAIVTGGASGINFAFVKLLTAKGANVVVADVQETGPLSSFINDKRSNRILFKKTDVSSFKDLRATFDYTKKNLGNIDLMCNGAGIFEPDWSNFWINSETDNYKSVDINLSGLMYGTRLAIQDQIKRAKSRKPKETIGAILNISSLAAQYALFNTPLYCASKAGVSSFTRTLSPLHEEYGIKVVAVSPGMVKTPLWTEHPEKMRGLAAQDEFLTPEEMAEAMITVVESDKYLGGTVLEVIKNRTRVVNVDSPLPSGPGSTMSNIGVIYEETIGLLEKERTS